MRPSQDGAISSSAPGGAAILRMDCVGMRCPQPVLRLAAETVDARPGTIVEIVGDCPTFEKDVRVFCDRRKKTVLSIERDGAKVIVRIQY